MPLAVIVAAAAVGASVPLLWWAVSSSRQPAAEAVAKNLTLGGPARPDLRRARLQESARERALQPLVATVAARARRITPAGMVESIEARIQLAGMQRWTADAVLAAKFLGTIVMGGIGLLVAMGGTSLMSFVAGALFLAFGYFGPDAVLSGRADRRQKAIENELADTLDQITISVEAGLGFEAAVARVGQTGTGPLAEELSRMLQDIQLGVSRREALRKLTERTDVPDLRRFVHAMVQAEAYGIAIAQVLRVQSAEMRDKRKQRAEERAMKIPVKIVFPVVFCIFPTLFIVILGPSVIRIVQNWPQ